jgi:spoIIIJ-associated protein
MNDRSAEGRGASVDEAVAAALEQLGVGREDVDVEVLSEPRRGLFGGGRRAHVRVVLRDQQEAADVRQTDQGEGTEPPAETAAATGVATDTAEPEDVTMSDTDTDTDTTDQSNRTEDELTPEEWIELLDRDADLAADFIEGLLDLLDLPGDIEIVTEEQQAFVTVQDVGSGLLIGRRGATLEALQELVRCAIQRQTERRSHVRVDVEGYRARQLEKLRDKCRDAIAEVRETGEPVRLEPMDAYERKMMHDLVAKTGKVTSSSEGNEPRRRVVIHPAED